MNHHQKTKTFLYERFVCIKISRCPDNCPRGKLPSRVWFRARVRIRFGRQFSTGGNCPRVTYQYLTFMYRSGRPKVFYKKGIIKNFARLTRKHLCRNLFFNNVARLRLFYAFREILRTHFLIEHLCLLPLYIAFLFRLNDITENLFKTNGYAIFFFNF